MAKEKKEVTSLHEYIIESAAKKEKTPAEWFNNAVENLKYCKLATHIGKFTHPDADVDVAIYCKPNQLNGYVTTGNTTCQWDVSQVANYSSSGGLLLQPVLPENSVSVLEGILTNDKPVEEELDLLGLPIENLKTKIQWLNEERKKTPKKTDRHIKQVYFPIAEGEYHLLSIMPSSSLSLEMYQRIRKINGHKINCYDKTSEDYGKPCEEVTELTMISFGGTQPQNISALNSLRRGKAYLLSSLPPSLQEVKVRIPKSDFFKEYIWQKSQKKKLYQLHDYMKSTRNNLNVRRNIRALVHKTMGDVIDTAYKIRATGNGWSNDEKYTNLPHAQKIWLDDIYKEERKNNDWLQEIAGSFARWMIASYEKTLGNEKIILGDREWLFIKQFMEKKLKDEVKYE